MLRVYVAYFCGYQNRESNLNCFSLVLVDPMGIFVADDDELRHDK